MRAYKGLGLITVLGFVLTACGGDSTDSDELLETGRPGVSVEGLEQNQSVTVGISASDEALTFNSDGTRRFSTVVFNTSEHTVAVTEEVGSPGCVFSGGKTSSSARNPRHTHQLACGAAAEEVEEEDEDEDEDAGDVGHQLDISMDRGTAAQPIEAANPATVTATLADGNGNPVSQRLIAFSATLGELNPASGTALTNTAGEATIELRAGDEQGAGTIEALFEDDEGEAVTASRDFQTAGDDVEGVVTGEYSLALESDRGTAEAPINADNPATLTATLENRDGDLMPNEVVRFTSAIGRLSPESGSVLTDGDGQASITLTAGNVEEAGVVEAIFEDAGGVMANDVISLMTEGDESEPDAPYRLTLDADRGSASDPINADNPATLTATLTDHQGDALTDRLVNFATTLGDLSPENGTALTDENGRATITLRAGSEEGAGTAEATFSDRDGNSVTETRSFYTEGDDVAIAGFTLGLELLNTDNPGNEVGTNEHPVSSSSPATVRAILEEDGEPVQGELILFEANAGTFAGPDTGMTDSEGVAETVLEADGTSGAGTLEAVFVTPDGQEVVVTINFVIEDDPRLHVELEDAGSLQDPIAPGNPATVRVSLTRNGTPLAGEIVELESNLAQVSSGSVLTDDNGEAQALLEAGEASGAGTLTARFTLDGLEIVEHVNYSVTGSVDEYALALDIRDGSGNVLGTVDDPIAADRPATVRATLTRNDEPVANEQISFSLDEGLGEFQPGSASALTDGSGMAQITLRSGTEAGADVLRARFTDSETEEETEASRAFRTLGDRDFTDPVPELGIGRLDAGVFEEELRVVGDPDEISAGGTAQIMAEIVNLDDDELWTEPLQVTFRSSCVDDERAEIDERAIAVGGQAVATYSPRANCVQDIITAEAELNEVVRTASVVVDIDPAPAGNIRFEEANPAEIGLQGSSQAGIPETSRLEFLVSDENGEPVGSGRRVNFELETLAGQGGDGEDFEGAAKIAQESAITNAQGIVTVVVESGAVPQVLAVRATLDEDENIATTGTVSVNRGPISQDRFVVFAEINNLLTWQRPGTGTEFTVRAADRFGNWVPDGTQINFTTELGDIEPSCETEDGTCSVTWTSQGIQTINFDENRVTRGCFPEVNTVRRRHGLPIGLPCGVADRFGRSTVTAWAIGEEGFDDQDGTNLFGQDEAAGDHWVALPEAFRDDNEIGLFTDSDDHFEDFIDFDGSGDYSEAGDFFRGVGCTEAARDAGHCESLANVRASQVLVSATDRNQMFVYAEGTLLGDIDWASAVGPGVSPEDWGDAVPWGADAGPVDDDDYTVMNEELVGIHTRTPQFTVLVSDRNGNAPAQGTTVTVEGGPYDVVGSDSCTVENRTEPRFCTFTLREDTEDALREPLAVTVDQAGESLVRVIGVAVPGEEPAYSLTLESTGGDISDISAGSPAQVTATLLDQEGDPVENRVVEFEAARDLGEIDPQTALTNANGEATIEIRAGDEEGADTLIATFEDEEGEEAVGHIGFFTQGDG